jgi:ankyrin repeat protein
MNKFIKAIKELDLDSVQDMVRKDAKWLEWAEPSGKNALHYLGGLVVGDDMAKADEALRMVKFLLAGGMDINSIHRIEEKNCDHFPATPLWYAYTRGRNEKLYKYLLKSGANPNHCMWAIAWYDDIDAAKLFIKHGANLDEKPSKNELFLGAFAWKKYKFAEWLLKEGADVNAPGPRGYTALVFAVKRREQDTVRMLLKYGADPDTEGEDGMSARKLAEEKGPKRIAKLLE